FTTIDTFHTVIYTLSLHDALPICMLLHQFLTYQQPNQPKTNTHQPQYQQKTEPETVNLKPNIEVFYCDRKSFSLNDYISVHWQVDRKSTRLNSSHVKISYAVFCLK